MTAFFTFRDLSFEVSSNHAADLAWLEEFLSPSFSSSPPLRDADVQVQMRQDAGDYEALLGCGPLPGGTVVDAFTLDNSTIVLPLWNGPDGYLTLHEEKFELFFMVSEDRREVRLLAKGGPRYRTPLMRVLREYVMNHFMQGGGVFFHASAVAFDGRGLLIVGTKNAGKTSLLTHFLRHAGAEYIANDRVFTHPDSSPRLLQGVPTIATIRSTMPPLFPGLPEQLAGSRFHHHLTLAECAERDRLLQPWENGKYGLTPAQLLSLHDARPTANARPRAVLFPRVIAGTAKDSVAMAAVPIGRQDVEQRLPGALFGAETLRNRAEVFSLGGPGLPPTGELLQRCAGVTASLPCFELRLGVDAYRSPRASDRALARVLEES